MDQTVVIKTEQEFITDDDVGDYGENKGIVFIKDEKRETVRENTRPECAEEIDRRNGERSYKCNVCGKGMKNIGALKGHKLQFHGKHRCWLCGRCFRSVAKLEDHEKTAHGEENVPSYGTVRESARPEEIDRRDGERPYKCNICGKRMKNIGALKTHKLLFHGKHRCWTCGRCFRFVTELEDHEKIAHENVLSYGGLVKGTVMRRCEPSGLDTFTSDRRWTVERHNSIKEEPGSDVKDSSELWTKAEGKLEDETRISASTSGVDKFTNDGSWTVDRDMRIKKEPRSDLKYSSELWMKVKGELQGEANITASTSTEVVKVESPKSEQKQPCSDNGVCDTQMYSCDKVMNTYTCKECGTSFITASSLAKHMHIHKLINSYTCDKCGKSFRKSENLIIHQRLHEGIRPHICHECGKSFTTYRYLGVHRRIHKRLNPFICEKCGKSYTTAGSLAVHQRIYKGIKPYTCDECGKSFTAAGNFTLHQRIHKGIKPYTCDECSKSFIRSGDLAVHTRIHTGAYACEDCGRKFTRTWSLARHKLIHSGDKPYACEDCAKKFRDSSNLAVHKRIHSGDKPYACEDCGKKFTQNSNLVIHKRIH